MLIKTTFQFIANPICLLFRPGTLSCRLHSSHSAFPFLFLFYSQSLYYHLQSSFFFHSLFMSLLSTTNSFLLISIKISVCKSGLRTGKRPQLDWTGPEKNRTAVLVFDI